MSKKEEEPEKDLVTESPLSHGLRVQKQLADYLLIQKQLRSLYRTGRVAEPTPILTDEASDTEGA